MASDEFLLAILLFVVVGGLFWFLLQKQNALAKTRMLRVESINRLVEKFATAKELTDFLETEAGRKLLEDPLTLRVGPVKLLSFSIYSI